MTKEILKQYTDLQKECAEVREKINKLEEQIQAIERDGSVIDKVNGGIGGWQTFKIEGFPYPAYSRKKTLLYARKAVLSELEMEILEMLKQIEEFISDIDDSYMRRIIRLRFVDGLSWKEVAQRTGGNTEDTAKKMFYRFMEKE